MLQKPMPQMASFFDTVYGVKNLSYNIPAITCPFSAKEASYSEYIRYFLAFNMTYIYMYIDLNLLFNILKIYISLLPNIPFFSYSNCSILISTEISSLYYYYQLFFCNVTYMMYSLYYFNLYLNDIFIGESLHWWCFNLFETKILLIINIIPRRIQYLTKMTFPPRISIFYILLKFCINFNALCRALIQLLNLLLMLRRLVLCRWVMKLWLL